MFCSRCGSQNPDTGTTCINCGAPLAQQAGGAVPTPPPPGAVPTPLPGQSYSTPTTGYPSSPGYSGTPDIPNYLVHAILVTICCCLPLGIVSIVFAAQVNGKIAAGDIAGATDASNKAKTFALIGFIVGLVVNGLVVGLQVLTGIAASQH